MLTTTGLQYHITLDKHDDAIKGLITAATKLDDQTRLLLIDANDHISECESDSESSCDEGIANNLQELVQSIKVYTTCLTDLGSALVCPALEPKFDDEPEEATPEPRLATDYRPELMIIKSPEAVSCLPRKLIPIPLDSRRRNEQPRKLHAHITPMQNERSCFTGSEFYDSGVGTSIPNADSTFASYVVDIDCAERFSGFAWDVESHSDLASERGKIVYGDIRGVGGWLKPFLVSDFVPQLEVTFEKDGGMSNVDSEPAALRQAQEKEFPDARKSIDNTAKPDVGLGSSVSRQSIELTDSESKRVAEFFTSPTGVSTRKDDVTEISIQHVLGVNNVESNHTTWEDQNLTMTGYWDERGKQVHESLQKTHAPSEIVFPSGEPKVMQELLRSILSCNRCWKDRQKVIKSRNLQESANGPSASETIARGQPSATDVMSSGYPAREAQRTLSRGPFVETGCLAIHLLWLQVQRYKYRLQTTNPTRTLILQTPPWISANLSILDPDLLSHRLINFSHGMLPSNLTMNHHCRIVENLISPMQAH
jgi:hypothetical protein